MVESGSLLRSCIHCGYRGFESLPLRFFYVMTVYIWTVENKRRDLIRDSICANARKGKTGRDAGRQ